MLASNILLSGNNYYKIAHLFYFMNMGMVNKDTFFAIQDTYVVDGVKEFWEKKRSDSINRLKGKEVVVIGESSKKNNAI